MRKIFFITIIILNSIQIFAQRENPSIRKGNRAFDTKKFPNAESQYQKAKNINKNSLIASYNLANAQYKQKNFQSAIDNLQAISQKSKNADTLANIYYNTANSYTKIAEDSLAAKNFNGAIKNLENAVNFYKSAIKQNPKDFDAKYNYLLTKQILDELKKQQQNQQNQQNQNKQDQKNQQNKDKDKQDQKQDQNNQDKDKQNKPKEQQQSQIPYDKMIQMLNAVQNQDQQTQQKVKLNLQNNVKQNDKNW